MRRHDRGFGLIEYLIALAIMSPLAYVGTMTISRIVTGAQRSSDEMASLQGVQNLGYWISRDLLTAQSTVPGNDPNTVEPDLVTFVWTDWETAQTYRVHYYYEDMGDGLNRIKRRSEVLDAAQATLSDTTTMVANMIVSPVSLTRTDNIWKLVVQARSHNRTETKEYDVLPRPNA